uniref:C-type lectin domain-containing protein n=1 Tax=Panagrolaimus sp. ES5 TaxID=591445 RepID=A0AC34F938_9BILA
MKYKNQCYYFQQTQAPFFVAESSCNNLGGHLVSIHSLVDNMIISQQALVRFTQSTDNDFWLGSTDLYSAQKWSWMDNTSFDFENWDFGQPQNLSGYDCGGALMHGGKWKADDCFKLKPFICAIPELIVTTTSAAPTAKPKSCPVPWTYYETTGFCYVVLQGETWVNAEERCKVENGHLASIHDLNEDLFVAHIRGTNETYQTWTGLFTDDNNAHWSWTDGSPFNYSNWWTNQPDNPGQENCGTILFDGTFNNLNCNQVTSYICKKIPS